MSRWKPDGRGRLQQAALTLFRERGYDGTTVADISARAGLTERTFFRHFVEKSEVLFPGFGGLEAIVATTVSAAPAGMGPLDLAAAALDATAVWFEQLREGAVLRQHIIDASPVLQARELVKFVSFAAALGAALRERGVNDFTAALVAEVAVAAFRVAFLQWARHDNETSERSLQDFVREALEELRRCYTHRRLGRGRSVSRTLAGHHPVRP